MNLRDILNIARVTISYLPQIKTIVQEVETLFPAGSNGAQKLAALQTGLQTAFDVAGVAQTEFNSMWPAIQSVVSFVVAAFHKDGTFPPKAA